MIPKDTLKGSQRWALTQEGFDSLLAWLDPDRERAGKLYENIRRRLIRIFVCRGCAEPEDLADQTINRVAKRIDEIKQTYSGDPALYFYGVANKVYLESLRRKREITPPAPETPSEEMERELNCLDQCMKTLPSDNRELVLQYYQKEKHDKILHRQNLAQQLGIPLNALRIRAHRIRGVLRDCVRDCLVEQMAE